MKNLSFLVLLSLAMVATSCGNKNESGGGGSFSSDPLKASTEKGLINVDNYAVTVGGKSFQLSQQSYQIAVQAIVLASQQQPPIPLNSARQLKANITGFKSCLPYIQQGYQQGYQQPGYVQPCQKGTETYLHVSQMVIYR